jgi:hypothetical protein
MLDISYSTTTLSSELKPKYSLSISNKCAYLLETLVDNVFRHNYSMMQIKKKLNDGKILG